MMRRLIVLGVFLAVFLAQAQEVIKYGDFEFVYVDSFPKDKGGGKLYYDKNSVKVDKEKGIVKGIMLSYPSEEKVNKVKEEVKKLYQETEKETGEKPAISEDAMVKNIVIENESIGCVVETDCKSDNIKAFCQDGFIYNIQLSKDSPYQKLNTILCKYKEENK